MEYIKKILNKRIQGGLRDMGDFHKNTFDIEDCNSADVMDIGHKIDKFLQGYEMTKEEDASYLAGKLDAYRDMFSVLCKEKTAFQKCDVSQVSYTQYGDMKRTGANLTNIKI